MLILLSPAKIQRFDQPKAGLTYSQATFLSEAGKLVEQLRKYSVEELAEILHVNQETARLNADRLFNWQVDHNLQNSRQAMLVFNGEVFRGLNAANFQAADFDYAQNHLRILSGLYGVLRPLDLMQPYRIDLIDQIKTEAGNQKLYDFWREKITQNILESAQNAGNSILNLLSGEYFKAFDKKKLKVPIIDIEFLESKNGNYKPIVVYTKKARGLLARYVICNRIEKTEEVQSFSDEGYCFNPRLSSESKFVFTR